MSYGERRLGPELVGIQPSNEEILSAFILYSPKGIPQDEALLAQGIKKASEKAPFLSRFIDQNTGELTESLQSLIKELEEKGVLLSENGIFTINPDKVDTLTSSTRMIFRDPGTQILREAAGAAQRVWSI